MIRTTKKVESVSYCSLDCVQTFCQSVICTVFQCEKFITLLASKERERYSCPQFFRTSNSQMGLDENCRENGSDALQKWFSVAIGTR